MFHTLELVHRVGEFTRLVWLQERDPFKIEGSRVEATVGEDLAEVRWSVEVDSGIPYYPLNTLTGSLLCNCTPSTSSPIH